METEKPDVQVIGFDARPMGGDWRAERPEMCWDGFLLRSDLVRPLSTDSNVWDSSFDWDGQKGLPDWWDGGPLAQLWHSLDKLVDFLATAPSSPAYGVVAFGRVRDSDAEARLLSERQMLGRNNVVPSEPDVGWRLLGYDVSDPFQLSALMNCGLAIEPRAMEFAKDLNEHHLFDDLPTARAFCALSDELVPEHSPFFVYALYLIKVSP